MAEILLYWGWDADLLECPQYIADDINIYQRQFDKWISNPNNHHSYWTKDSEDELALCFDGTAFLEWLNNIVLANEKRKSTLYQEAICACESGVGFTSYQFLRGLMWWLPPRKGNRKQRIYEREIGKDNTFDIVCDIICCSCFGYSDIWRSNNEVIWV